MEVTVTTVKCAPDGKYTVEEQVVDMPEPEPVPEPEPTAEELMDVFLGVSER